jgi:hypothetical protein
MQKLTTGKQEKLLTDKAFRLYREAAAYVIGFTPPEIEIWYCHGACRG